MSQNFRFCQTAKDGPDFSLKALGTGWLYIAQMVERLATNQ